MSEPEIHRRCYYCGASIRERSAFCPQCGRALAGAPDLSTTSPIHDTEDIVVKDITLTEADFQRSAKGKPSDKKPKVEKTAQAKPTVAPEARPPAADEIKPSSASETKQSTPLNEAATVSEADEVAYPAKEPAEPHKAATHRVPYVGTKMQKATQRARDVQDNALHRVQKVREISTVMLEEASYDPSLRFVLVAGTLFVLFLLIMLLNKLIG